MLYRWMRSERARRGRQHVSHTRVSQAASLCRTVRSSHHGLQAETLPEARPGPTARNANTCSLPAPRTLGPCPGPLGSSLRLVVYSPWLSGSSDVYDDFAPLLRITSSESLSIFPWRAIPNEVVGAFGF